MSLRSFLSWTLYFAPSLPSRALALASEPERKGAKSSFPLAGVRLCPRAQVSVPSPSPSAPIPNLPLFPVRAARGKNLRIPLLPSSPGQGPGRRWQSSRSPQVGLYLLVQGAVGAGILGRRTRRRPQPGAPRLESCKVGDWLELGDKGHLGGGEEQGCKGSQCPDWGWGAVGWAKLAETEPLPQPQLLGRGGAGTGGDHRAPPHPPPSGALSWKGAVWGLGLGAGWMGPRLYVGKKLAPMAARLWRNRLGRRAHPQRAQRSLAFALGPHAPLSTPPASAGSTPASLPP